MVQLHWQAIVIPTQKQSKAWSSAKVKRKLNANDAFALEWMEGAFSDKSPVLWTPTENISKDRQFARGSHINSVRSSRMSIIGCGALGAPIAESFARGGLTDLNLFDGQQLEYGNLCRHTLEGRDVGHNKAIALANRLQASHPASNIRGFDCSVPFVRMNREDGLPWRSLVNSTTVLDCSTDEGAFQWLSQFARDRGIRLASMFINANATTLTLVLSGKHSNAKTVYRKLLSDIRESNTPCNPESYFSRPSDENMVLPVGCWHPTFPGLNYQIWLLAYSAIPHIVQWIDTPWRCDGYGILISRNEHESVGAIVQTVWNRAYR
jgi:molybdopterin/thiamine biosynthesis adenylyltransferase